MHLPVYTAETPKTSCIRIIQKSSFTLPNLADFRGKYCSKENCLFCIVREVTSSEACSLGVIGLEKTEFCRTS
jgi:hypothetical protein